MSDSGRVIGECGHGGRRDDCAVCLRAEIARLSSELVSQTEQWSDQAGEIKRLQAIIAAHDLCADLLDRFREALTWAVGFIRCNLPKTYDQYPDMRNAASLVADGGIEFGEFQRVAAHAELAEVERDRLRALLPEVADILSHFAVGTGLSPRELQAQCGLRSVARGVLEKVEAAMGEGVR